MFGQENEEYVSLLNAAVTIFLMILGAPPTRGRGAETGAGGARKRARVAVARAR